jgi:hypothetical protein
MIFRRIIVAAAMAVGFALSAASSASAQGVQLFAVLVGGNEVAGGDGNGYGAGSVIFVPGGICYSILVNGIGTPELAHIHERKAGVNGDVVINLDVPSAGNKGTVSGCVDVPSALRDRIRRSPNLFYFNVHNDAFPGGAIRGQLF